MDSEIELTLHALNYQLLINLLDENDSFRYLDKQVVALPYDKKRLRLSVAQQTALLDALGDLILVKGITDGEINAFGLIIEPLIDIVGQNFYD
ncbi:hypothetical protein SAMN00120144_4320 [Hymenobacter roseosalivarius DSM 11622]|uniref:Uncharacterized protein n=1 Tax=Hymenobacter roseosalivarius DSM 11622 TaxID=645990 RepID=A0A1W1W542_9BACT|nr:hypothetical protein [Hymenobacter roseosalivarius]SMC00653.1 hypothetical protein SAMN00120144_4320 [Hymenobacter roseosalivarius DSM 11622]